MSSASPSKTNHQLGLDAETACSEYFKNAGYKIISIRYKTKHGEIDLIARDKSTLLFIEVKRRKAAIEDDPVSPTQKQRIINAALQYLAENPEISELDMRFDCILVDNNLALTHIKDSWRIES